MEREMVENWMPATVACAWRRAHFSETSMILELS